jgi:hypothetical protein
MSEGLSRGESVVGTEPVSPGVAGAASGAEQGRSPSGVEDTAPAMLAASRTLRIATGAYHSRYSVRRNTPSGTFSGARRTR